MPPVNNNGTMSVKDILAQLQGLGDNQSVYGIGQGDLDGKTVSRLQTDRKEVANIRNQLLDALKNESGSENDRITELRRQLLGKECKEHTDKPLSARDIKQAIFYARTSRANVETVLNRVLTVATMPPDVKELLVKTLEQHSQNEAVRDFLNMEGKSPTEQLTALRTICKLAVETNPRTNENRLARAFLIGFAGDAVAPKYDGVKDKMIFGVQNDGAEKSDKLGEIHLENYSEFTNVFGSLQEEAMINLNAVVHQHGETWRNGLGAEENKADAADKFCRHAINVFTKHKDELLKLKDKVQPEDHAQLHPFAKRCSELLENVENVEPKQEAAKEPVVSEHHEVAPQQQQQPEQHPEVVQQQQQQPEQHPEVEPQIEVQDNPKHVEPVTPQDLKKKVDDLNLELNDAREKTSPFMTNDKVKGAFRVYSNLVTELKRLLKKPISQMNSDDLATIKRKEDELHQKLKAFSDAVETAEKEKAESKRKMQTEAIAQEEESDSKFVDTYNNLFDRINKRIDREVRLRKAPVDRCNDEQWKEMEKLGEEIIKTRNALHDAMDKPNENTTCPPLIKTLKEKLEKQKPILEQLEKKMMLEQLKKSCILEKPEKMSTVKIDAQTQKILDAVGTQKFYGAVVRPANNLGRTAIERLKAFNALKEACVALKQSTTLDTIQAVKAAYEEVCNAAGLKDDWKSRDSKPEPFTTDFEIVDKGKVDQDFRAEIRAEIEKIESDFVVVDANSSSVQEAQDQQLCDKVEAILEPYLPFNVEKSNSIKVSVNALRDVIDNPNSELLQGKNRDDYMRSLRSKLEDVLQMPDRSTTVEKFKTDVYNRFVESQNVLTNLQADGKTTSQIEDLNKRIHEFLNVVKGKPGMGTLLTKDEFEKCLFELSDLDARATELGTEIKKARQYLVIGSFVDSQKKLICSAVTKAVDAYRIKKGKAPLTDEAKRTLAQRTAGYLGKGLKQSVIDGVVDRLLAHGIDLGKYVDFKEKKVEAFVVSYLVDVITKDMAQEGEVQDPEVDQSIAELEDEIRKEAASDNSAQKVEPKADGATGTQSVTQPNVQGINEVRLRKFLEVMLQTVCKESSLDYWNYSEPCVTEMIRLLKERGGDAYQIAQQSLKKLGKGIDSALKNGLAQEDAWLQPMADLVKRIPNPKWATGGATNSKLPKLPAVDPPSVDLAKMFDDYVKKFEVKKAEAKTAAEKTAAEEECESQLENNLVKFLKDRGFVKDGKLSDLSVNDANKSKHVNEFDRHLRNCIANGRPIFDLSAVEKLETAFARLPPALMDMAVGNYGVQSPMIIVRKVLEQLTGVQPLKLDSSKLADNKEAYKFDGYSRGNGTDGINFWSNQHDVKSITLSGSPMLTFDNAMIKNNYGYGDCLFLSVLNGVDVENTGDDTQLMPTHENALKLRTDMMTHIRGLLEKRGADAPKGFVDTGDAWLIAQGKDDSGLSSVDRALVEYMGLDEGHFGADMANGSTFADVTFSAFLADMLKRPIVVISAITVQEGTSMRCFDRDLTTGLPLPGEPIVLYQTADTNSGSGHYQTLKLDEATMNIVKGQLAQSLVSDN